MKKLNINIDKGSYQEKNGVTKFVPYPDVRPLNERKKTISKSCKHKNIVPLNSKGYLYCTDCGQLFF